MVLTWFHSDGLAHVPEPFRVIEFFAGDGNVGRSCQFAFIATAMLDIRMGNKGFKKRKSNAFDLTTPSGLAFLALFFFFGGGGEAKPFPKY